MRVRGMGVGRDLRTHSWRSVTVQLRGAQSSLSVRLPLSLNPV